MESRLIVGLEETQRKKRGVDRATITGKVVPRTFGGNSLGELDRSIKRLKEELRQPFLAVSDRFAVDRKHIPKGVHPAFVRRLNEQEVGSELDMTWQPAGGNIGRRLAAPAREGKCLGVLDVLLFRNDICETIHEEAEVLCGTSEDFFGPQALGRDV